MRAKVHWMKVVGVKVRGTVVLLMVVETELLLLATSAIRVRITGHRSEVTRLTYKKWFRMSSSAAQSFQWIFSTILSTILTTLFDT